MLVEIDIIIHATEDMNKILNSLKRLFNIEEYKLERRDLTGHYKNPVIFLKLRLRNLETKRFISRLFKMMNEIDKDYLLMNLDEYIDRERLYIRIEKNGICKGEVRLAVQDPIKITIYNIDRKKILSYIDEKNS
ncbi:TPA: hypothetical protein EYP83_03670 [Candidatus Geothermarchaeota archaeon]|nr:hypothetical protein [Candidatus Geothermarchaeota archaeon]HIQ13197.1 hypothetical protein [Thermoprotei archaeon]